MHLDGCGDPGVVAVVAEHVILDLFVVLEPQVAVGTGVRLLVHTIIVASGGVDGQRQQARPDAKAADLVTHILDIENVGDQIDL